MTNKLATEEFSKLLDTCDELLGPEGCPWDREQTLLSMRSSILEEACEVIEAVDEGNNADLIEELGDLLYNVVFFSKLGEKEERFSIEEPVRSIREKLISRHPHVFGKEECKDPEAVIDIWEKVKREEKPHRESVLDGIPKALPALSRAYKMVGKLKCEEEAELFETEEELGKLLWQICAQARSLKIHPEHSLRKFLMEEEKLFREEEKNGAASPS